MSGFPYWRYSLDNELVMFERLKSSYDTINTKEESNHVVVIRRYPEDYKLCDQISNHFTENIRVKCKFAQDKTPYEVWNEVKKDKEYKKLNKEDQREHIYSLTRECNTFNPTYCLYIILKLVGPNAKILDPSSGWGDRLIASIASEAELYHGFDPNKCLQTGYNKIKKVFNGKNIKIKYIPFEESKLEENFYDLAITSPPYFTLEQYSDESTQSVVRYNDYHTWVTSFYTPYINKMISAIRPGGYISIYIEDITVNKQRYDLRKLTIRIMDNNNQMSFHDQIGFRTGSKTRWSLIWRKL